VAVAVEQPRALIEWPLLDEPVVIVPVASIQEVARHDFAVADRDVRLSLMDLGKAGAGPGRNHSPTGQRPSTSAGISNTS
jgi:hypothetical protein